MAKILEETVTVKLSRLVSDTTEKCDILDTEQRELLHSTILQVCEQVLDSPSVIVEVV